ncbi:conserved exported hypothetical protein [Tenacibaculum sediminilitoris]|uniref:DUF4270 family protein n=1 Tax=Tenacibaculum sediminilitoris TaxID=1820334 RepID=UPI003895E2C0
MIRKIGVLGISLLCLAAVTSCEKDFSEVGTNVINNDKFETGEFLLDIEITPIDIDNVQSDNINTSINEYWLGVYNNPNAEKIEASIISQVGYISGLKNTAGTDTIVNLDKVILKLPYISTSEGKNSNRITTFRLDSILGNVNVGTSVIVKQNNTYLNTLNPDDPSKKNTFFSDFSYESIQSLNEDANFTFKPSKTDTLFSYQRIDRFNPSKTYEEIVKTKAVISGDTIPIPFLAIPLDVSKMKTLFWDKLEGAEFASKENFDNYFRGLIIEAYGNDGALVPFNLASSPSPSLEFHYTKSVVNASNVVTDTINKKYRFPLSGIKNSGYKMSSPTNSIPSNSFIVQGTAGKMAKITIFDEAKLQELRSNNWLINDASLTFYVNQTINSDADIIPQRLFLYQNKENKTGGFSPTQLTDAYIESATFGGVLEKTDEDTPEKYTFRITDYISNLLSGKEDATVDPLILKVYNPTDTPVTSTSISTYNWNPRFVTLLNGDDTANGTKRAVLKISYSKEK